MADAASGAPAPSSSSATAAAATPSAGEGGSQQGRGGGRGGRGGKGGGREGRGRGGGRRGGRGPAVAAAGPSDAGGDAAAGPAERGRGRGGAGGGGGKRGGGGRGGGGGGGGGRGRGGRGGRGGGRGARAEGGKAPVDAVAAALAGSLTLEEPGAHGGHGHDHDHHDCCIVCTEPLDGGRHRPAAGSCEHRETCALCFMRLRLLVKDMSCPVCKAELENVFVFESPQDTRPYAALHIWGTEAGPGVVYDDRAQLFMPKAFHEGVFKPIQAPNCPVPGCGTQCRSLGALKDHLRSAHEKRGFCDVCLDHKKVFVGEQQLYSKGELQRHIDKGEPSQGFLGHPACRFCKGKRVYDMGELYKHLREEHWACTICQRDRGIQHTYYRDYPELERHFRKEHHLCEDAACLAQRFVVFGHPLDLHSHIVNAHPERAQASRRRLELDVNAFRIRGQQGGGGDAQAEQEGGDGGAQAGGAGGGGWNVTGAPAVSAASHPEAFPELSAAATQAGLARAPSGGGVSRQQAFPPLSGAANGGGQQRRAPPPAATQRPTALAAARALIQPMPPVVTRQAGTGAWGSSGGRVPATVAASQALRQQLSSSSSSDGGAVAGAGGGGADDGVVHRNRRFAEALGITGGIEGQAAALLAASSTSTASSTEQAADAFRLDLERPVYPRELLAWASNPATKLEVQRLEERVAAFLGDRKEASLYLKPMPREERRRVHLLAEFYGLQSVSYDNDPKRFVALIKAPGTKPAVPVITLSQTAAAEHAAALHARATGHAVGGILRPPPGSGMLNATAKPPAPAPSPYAPSTPGAAATVVVTHLGEQSGKAVTDRLRQLLPGLPLCGYRREAPPGAPQDADRSREILVVELSSGEAAAALLERAARRPDALHPFQLRAGVGAVAAAAAASAASASAGGVEGAGVAPSRPPPTAAAPPPPVEGGSGSGEGAGGGGARGRWGWGQSVLAGRLKPRTLPPPPPPATTELRPTLFSAMMEQQQQQQRKKGGAGAPKISKARKGPVAGAGVNTRLAAEEELRTGQVVRSNRWEGLLSDDEEEEEEEGTGAEAAGGEAGVEKGEEGQRADSEQADAGADADASARVASAASSEHGDGDGEAEEEEEEEEDGWEDEEEEDEDMEVECGRCTYKYLSADYCPMCQAPRK